MMDDWQLLKSYAAEGSQDAFTELVRRHINFVYSAALRQAREPELAKDITQLVFANLARRAKSLRSSGSLTGWLHRDTCFTSLDLLRRERRRIAREQHAVAMQESDNLTEAAPDWSRIRPRIDAALSQLTQSERDALLLRFVEQRSLRDVGAVLGLQEDAARKRVSRSLEKLRLVLVRQGVTTTGAALSVALSTCAVQSAPSGLMASVLVSSLAAGASSASGLAGLKLFEIITMTKLKTTIVGVVLTAGLGTPLILLHQSNKAVQQKNDALLAQTTEFAQLQADNARLSNRLAQMMGDRSGDEQKLELARLRGEVGRLRSEKNDAEKQNAKMSANRSQTSKAQPKAPAFGDMSFPRDRWTFAGYTNPESAMLSLAWSGLEGNLETFMNSLTPAQQARQKQRWQDGGKSETEIRDQLVKELGGTKSIRILDKASLSENDVVLSLVIEAENGRTEAPRVKLQRIGEEWKIADPDYNPSIQKAGGPDQK